MCCAIIHSQSIRLVAAPFKFVYSIGGDCIARLPGQSAGTRLRSRFQISQKTPLLPLAPSSSGLSISRRPPPGIHCRCHPSSWTGAPPLCLVSWIHRRWTHPPIPSGREWPALGRFRRRAGWVGQGRGGGRSWGLDGDHKGPGPVRRWPGGGRWCTCPERKTCSIGNLPEQVIIDQQSTKQLSISNEWPGK